MELLVAAAVSIVLMLILTEAFKRGIDMFRTLRAQGQLQERLRFVSTILREDLSSPHFEEADGYHLSAIRLDQPGGRPPRGGFVRIYQGPDPFNPTNPVNNPNGEPCVFEGTDNDGMLYTRATTHILHFSVFRRDLKHAASTAADFSQMFRALEPKLGNHPDPRFPVRFVDPPDFLERDVFASRRSEVAYFLDYNGRSANGTLLFNLYRRTKLLLPPPPPDGHPDVPPDPVQANPAGYQENWDISARWQIPGGARYYNRPADVTEPRNRFALEPAVDANDPNCAGLIVPGLPYVGPPPHGGPAPEPTYRPLWRDLPPVGTPPSGLNHPQAGDDILISDVISFEIKATWDAPDVSTGYVIPGYQAPYSKYGNRPREFLSVPGIGSGPLSLYPNTDYPFDYLPIGANPVLSDLGLRVFDTWSKDGPYSAWNSAANGTRIPLRIRVKSIMIKLRIWDAKAEQTRQLTIIVDV